MHQRIEIEQNLFTKGLSNHVSRAHERYDLCTDSYILEKCDIDIENDDDIGLILEKEYTFFYRKAQTFGNKFQ